MPRSTGSKSTPSITCNPPLRRRTCASNGGLSAPRCTTTKIVAGSVDGRADVILINGSTAPAEPPITTMSCPDRCARASPRALLAGREALGSFFVSIRSRFLSDPARLRSRARAQAVRFAGFAIAYDQAVPFELHDLAPVDRLLVGCAQTQPHEPAGHTVDDGADFRGGGAFPLFDSRIGAKVHEVAEKHPFLGDDLHALEARKCFHDDGRRAIHFAKCRSIAPSPSSGAVASSSIFSAILATRDQGTLTVVAPKILRARKALQ